MKIQAGIRTLLDIVVATPAAEDYQIVETLLRRGLSELDAERLIAFLPMACGRAVLEAEGVHYPETFLARDESGREARGRLIDEPVFRAGQAFVKQHGISSVAVRRLAERSAEVNAFRAMRSQGADLKIGEAVLLRLPVDAVHSRSW